MNIPFEFTIFGLVLASIVLFHRFALQIACAGLLWAVAYKLVDPESGGAVELVAILSHEWVVLLNLLLLLVGFAMIASHFEKSRLPHLIPRLLPAGRLGGLVLLAWVFVLSIFLDNIAGAVIGGVVAKHVYAGRVRIGYLASIVAAANAGGAGSVIGDTTTTMMWLNGISPLTVAPAFIGAAGAFVVFGFLGAFQQGRFAVITARADEAPDIDKPRLMIVGLTLLGLVLANVVGNGLFPGVEERVPILGLALCSILLLMYPVRPLDWAAVPAAGKSALFLVALVALASLMPVDALPAPSTLSVFGLGVLSAAFDNIPLTALALDQGGYDWALLAYAVGFGGSMVWFGSSAGVTLTTAFLEARNVLAWLREGWHICVAYAAGFGLMLLVRG